GSTSTTATPSTPTSPPSAAAQLVDAIRALTQRVELCRERSRKLAEERPEELKGLLLPVEDRDALAELDARVYGLTEAAGLKILPERGRSPIHGMGYTDIPILRTKFIPDPGQSTVILAAPSEFQEWDTRMAQLLAAAELRAGVASDGL